MAEKFDPYRKWLGIPPEEQPPHHYRLLGIAPYEDDIDVITHAADRQMSHVRKFQAGQNGHLSQQILNELSKARICLLDRAQKIAYDQELQKTIGGVRQVRSAPVAAPRKASSSAPSSAPVPAPPQAPPPVSSVATMEPPVGSAMAPVAIPVAAQTIAAPAAIGARPTRTATTRIRRKSSPLPLVLGICGLAAVAALAALVAVVASSDFDDDAGYGETNTAVVHNMPNTNVSANRPRPDRVQPERPLRMPPRTADGTNGDGQPDKLIIPDNPDNHVVDEGSLPPITREPSPETDPTTDPDGETGGDETDPVMDPLEPNDDSPTTDEPQVTETDDDPPASEDPPAATGDGDDDEPLVDDPERTAKFIAAVDAANEAFSRRDLKEAARQLAAARQVKQGADEERQVIFLAELQQHLGAFWRLVATGTRKLKAGEEISFAGHTATFDQAEDGDVTLIVNGERKSRPLEDVEMHYLVALAERGAAKPDNKSRLAIAAFLALDANATEADRKTARKLLAEVLAEGGRSPMLEALFAQAPQR